MPRWLRLSATAAALVLLVPLVCGVAAYAWLQTGMGRQWVAARLHDLSGGQVEIANLGGGLPFRLTADRLAISDANGPWLVAEKVEIAVDGRGLLDRELRIETALAERLTVLRLPQGEPRKPGAPGPALPSPPIPIALGQLTVPHLILAAPVLGEPGEFTLNGAGSLDMREASFQLALDRSDGPGRASARLAYDRAADRLALDAEVEDPAGLAAQRLGAGAALPVSLKAAGDGPLSAWHGTLALGVGDARLDLDLTATGTGPRALALSGRADPRPLLPPTAARLLSQPVALAAELALGDNAMLRRFHIESGANRIAFDGALDLNDFSGSGRAELDLPDAAVLAPVLAIPVGGRLALMADLKMDREGQTAKLEATGTDLLLDRFRVQGAQLTGTASRPGRDGAVRVDATLATQGLVRAGPQSGPPLPPDLRIDVAGTVSPDFRSLKADRLAATSAGAELVWTGTAAIDGPFDGKLAVRVADISHFTAVSLPALRGGLAAEVALSAPKFPGRTHITLDGTWTNPASGIAAIDALLGQTVTTSAAGAIDSEAVLTVDRLGIQGAASLLVSGRVDPSLGAVDARYTVDVPDSSRLGVALGQKLAGSAHIEGTAAGPMADPKVSVDLSSPALNVAGYDLRNVKARLAALAVASQPNGTVATTLDLFGQPSALDAGFALSQSKLTLTDLKARVGRTSAAGGLTLGLEDGLVQGRLALDAPDFGPWSRLAGTPLAGSAKATVTLTPAGGLEADLTGTGIGVGSARLAQATATVRLQSWRGERRGTIVAELKRVEAGRATMDSVSLKLEPKGDALPFSITATGTVGAPLNVTSRGTVVVAKRQVRIVALDGRFADRPVHLDGATAISLDQGLTADPFTLRWGDTRIAGAFGIGGRLSGKLEVAALPIGDLGKLAGLEDLSGSSRATVTFSGTATAPAARFDAALSKVTVGEGRTAAPLGDVTLSGTLGRDGLDWQAKMAGGETGLTLSGSGRMPVLWTAPPFGIDYRPAQAMTARIAGSGLLAPVVALAGADEDRARGRFTVDLTITGSPADPVIAGSGRVADGLYENFASGAVLRNLTLDAVGERSRLRLRLSANDGNGGQVSAEGALELAGTSLAGLQLETKLDRFRAMRSDEIEARASGSLTLKGPLAALSLSGSVTMDDMAIHIPEKSPVRVAKLDVIEVNGPVAGTKPQATRAGPEASPAIEVALALDADLPKVTVDGQGLRSQWRGKVRVTGTTVAPVISGKLKLDRGTYTVLAKTLPLTEGQISFDGRNDLDPALRVVAEQRVEEVTARATLTGTLSSPLLDLSSDPPLPVEEVLSRLLFDRPAGELGPGQTLQLAQAAAALSGSGSSGLVDSLQKSLGVDRIDVTSNRTVDPQTGKVTETPSLTVGKDITENVHVGVAQGAAAGTGAVNVGVDVTRHLSVQSTVGQQGGGNVGLQWLYDY